MNRSVATVQSPYGQRASGRTRKAHPLLNAFPLTVMLLGTLLVVFALMMRLNADSDATFTQSTSISHVARSHGRTAAPIHVAEAFQRTRG